MYSKENKWDVLNIAWSFNPNHNIDLTYYKFTKKKSLRENRPSTTSWWGLRGMYIPTGIMGKTSVRIGFLLGGWMGKKFGYEIGYYHDFSSMPITSLFDMSWDTNSEKNKDRYGDTPHKDPASGMPSEFSRLAQEEKRNLEEFQNILDIFMFVSVLSRYFAFQPLFSGFQGVFWADFGQKNVSGSSKSTI